MPSQIQDPAPTSGPSRNPASESPSDLDPVVDETSDPMNDPVPATPAPISAPVPMSTVPTPATTVPPPTPVPATPNMTPMGPEEDPSTSKENTKRSRATKTKKTPKVMEFRVGLKETTAKYVGQLDLLVFTMLTTPRGICEREWAQENTYGTRAEFDAHFNGLSPAKRKVRRIAIGVNPTNAAPRCMTTRRRHWLFRCFRNPAVY